ncbi:MAG: 2-succinyl-5-enolpyruvyl-6-hydroxy-3-cyclohexene-1-carboxylic-acid synthase [Actinobacteria bacterium]|nr:2-succinyl-5-enolpyruvyl-6-hydroxy-3-cyclohexene-1-carboxylic-acid synthase [Actinomycetota bacterium]
MTLQATFVATLVDEWARAGVTEAVVAPGSRSSPLALALASRLRLHVLLDERSAGFYALGIGQASKRPAVVLTTSGTAAVELHPAVVEAHQSRVPMLVCTADRPADLHHISAPQTVVQGRLFGESVRWFAEPGVAEGFPVGSWRSLASRAYAETVAGRAGAGPVHLNLAFREPLVAEPDDLPPGRPHGLAWHQAVRERAGAPAGLAQRLSGRRGVIVAGRRGAGSAVHPLAQALGWPVLADPLSGARAGPGAVAAFDGLLRCASFTPAQQVETVLRLGDPPASKVLSRWLAGLEETDQVVVDADDQWPDPERTADLVVHADPRRCCEELAVAASPVAGEWLESWMGAEGAAQQAVDRVLAARPEATEPGVARALTGGLSDDVTLFVSSSMPIRDAEWFGAPGSATRVFANRGANGIDGIVSTALGVATGGDGPVVALLGDLAFLHDAGGLLGAAGRGLACTFVVLDNHGGGIFSFLPQAAALPPARFEALFGTPQEVDLAALAAVHGLGVTTVKSAEEVLPAVHEALRHGDVRLVHVQSDRQANVVLHEELQREIVAAVGRLSARGG